MKMKEAMRLLESRYDQDHIADAMLKEREKLDDLGEAFEDFFAQMKAEYVKANKEQDFGQ